MKRKFLFIFHGRFPSERAAALFAARNADSFAEAGEDVVFLAPRMRAARRMKETPHTYYHLKHPFEIVYLPTIDFFRLPVLNTFAFFISFFIFSFSVMLYLLRHASKNDILYSNETLPLFIASFFFPNVFYEQHDFPQEKTLFFSLFFKRMRGIITHNVWKTKNLKRIYSIRQDAICTELNAVDSSVFSMSSSKEEARKRLSLPPSYTSVVVYTGHLYGWKGAHILAQAAPLLPQTLFVFVGGREYDDLPEFQERFKTIPNIYLAGQRNHAEIPLWQKAADVLVLPNSGKKDMSRYHTSPMKLFEYMAAQRPIVASRLPSIEEITGNDSVYFVEPDDPQALAEGIKIILTDKTLSEKLVARAFTRVQEHSWERRAGRILSFVNQKAVVE